MELISQFQLRSRLEIHCMNSSKNLMFPQYLPLCPIIPDIVIVNTLLPPPSTGLRRQAPPGKRELNWPENRQRNEISRITRKGWVEGAGDLNLDKSSPSLGCSG